MNTESITHGEKVKEQQIDKEASSSAILEMRKIYIANNMNVHLLKNKIKKTKKKKKNEWKQKMRKVKTLL